MSFIESTEPTVAEIADDSYEDLGSTPTTDADNQVEVSE